MSATEIPAFSKTLERTNAWVDHLADILDLEDRHKTYMAMRGVLHALRDRLTPDEVADLSAQLPMLVRGFFYEGWNPAHKPLRYRHKEAFLERVHREAPWLAEDELERAVSGVFELLSSELGEGGETAQARGMLPAEVRELWAQPGL